MSGCISSFVSIKSPDAFSSHCLPFRLLQTTILFSTARPPASSDDLSITVFPPRTLSKKCVPPLTAATCLVSLDELIALLCWCLLFPIALLFDYCDIFISCFCFVPSPSPCPNLHSSLGTSGSIDRQAGRFISGHPSGVWASGCVFEGFIIFCFLTFSNPMSARCKCKKGGDECERQEAGER
eukprot:scaffold92943_cov72-Cyclotella_meneghiniana.AAC.1